MSGTSGIERVVTHGTFELDGGSWEVDNNIWIVGDDSEVIVIDAAHDAKAIEDAVGNRHVVAVVCTHGHNDHITVAPQLSKDFDAPVLLNPADEMLWRMTHGDKQFRTIEDGQVLKADGIELHAIATPGHSPGSTCLYAPALGAVFSGRHPVPGWAGRHRAFVLRLPDHPRLDQGQAGQAARRHRRLHRPRGHHPHR